MASSPSFLNGHCEAKQTPINVFYDREINAQRTVNCFNYTEPNAKSLFCYYYSSGLVFPENTTLVTPTVVTLLQLIIHGGVFLSLVRLIRSDN